LIASAGEHKLPDQGFARVPNGTGNFIIQDPTFSGNNNLVSLPENIVAVTGLYVFPNPATDFIHVRVTGINAVDLEMNDAAGRTVVSRKVMGETIIETQNLSPGMYMIRVQDNVKKIMVK
jgi:hypothetical protein